MMTDIFISYSASDTNVAAFIHKNLLELGVSAFLACVSVQFGLIYIPDNRDQFLFRANSVTKHLLDPGRRTGLLAGQEQ